MSWSHFVAYISHVKRKRIFPKRLISSRRPMCSSQRASHCSALCFAMSDSSSGGTRVGNVFLNILPSLLTLNATADGPVQTKYWPGSSYDETNWKVARLRCYIATYQGLASYQKFMLLQAAGTVLTSFQTWLLLVPNPGATCNPAKTSCSRSWL